MRNLKPPPANQIADMLSKQGASLFVIHSLFLIVYGIEWFATICLSSKMYHHPCVCGAAIELVRYQPISQLAAVVGFQQVIWFHKV